MLVHLDTDFAGDPDDACALALLLGMPDVDLVAVTTVADPDGRRAGYVHTLLRLAGRGDVPVASGAGVSRTTGAAMGDIPDHDRYWAMPTDPRPGRSGAATELLLQSIDDGAAIIGIGPLSNLGRLRAEQPDVYGRAHVTAMAGWFEPAPPGLPDWGPEQDWNTQCDPDSTTAAFAGAASLVLVPLSTTIRVGVRRSHLRRLESAGRVGRLLARQALAYCEDEGKQALAAAHPGLPRDLLNFHHDPLTAAVAAGWSGVTIERRRLSAATRAGALAFVADEGGRDVDVVTGVDAEAFDERWLSAVEALP